jgi:hypothetical protein
MCPDMQWMISKRVVLLLQHLRDRGDFGVTMGATGSKVVTPPSTVRLYERGMPPRGPWTCLEVCT